MRSAYSAHEALTHAATGRVTHSSTRKHTHIVRTGWLAPLYHWLTR